jgi:hypothetical protein
LSRIPAFARTARGKNFSGFYKWTDYNDSFRSLHSNRELSMTSAQAILTGAILIAASILFVNTIHPAAAQRGGPYALERNSNPNANSSVFRIDTSSGEVTYCFITANSELICTRGAR